MNWKKYGAYRIFDEFIETFFIKRKSYITNHEDTLDFESGLNKLGQCFIQAFDASAGKTFETKLSGQFKNASDNERIIFTNLEYLWAMPAKNISPHKKLQYASRWFRNKVRQGDKYFLKEEKDHVADPGSWNNRNKHTEICSLIYMLKYLCSHSPHTLPEAKKVIGEFSYRWIYSPKELKREFSIPEEVFKKSATQNFMLHLSDPDRYEAIVSDNHKDLIVKAFSEHLNGHKTKREEAIKVIKKAIFDDYADSEPVDRKERWFFYMDDVRAKWDFESKGHSKRKTEQEQQMQLAEAMDGYVPKYTATEGNKAVITITVRKRDSKIVAEVKKRDKYRCLACGFHYEKRIVHVHHLDPLAEQEGVIETKPKNLITLCPNCHALAHDLLGDSAEYKDAQILILKLGELIKKQTLCQGGIRT
jgi:hypothetical protein